MNQQAFYRDTAIGEFQLDANGRLAYRSWSKRWRTIQVQQYRMNQRATAFVNRILPCMVGIIDSKPWPYQVYDE